MDGLGWLIKNMLESQGIKINQQEIKDTIETAKVLIPRIAKQFDEIRASQKLIESQLAILLDINALSTTNLGIFLGDTNKLTIAEKK